MAPYSIYVRVIQTDPSNWFRIVENTVFSNGTWSEAGGQHKLTMGGSGTSGMLRFTNSSGDYFLVVLGIHNYKQWCDIVPDATTAMTCVQVHPTYYSSGNRNQNGMLWRQLANLDMTSTKGIKIEVDFKQQVGNNLCATISIAK